MLTKWIVAAAAATFVFAAAPAFADAQQVIAQCVTDNKDEGQTQQVILGYCTCMTEAMTAAKVNTSVTEWEATHKPEEEYCAAKAGWKEPG